MTSPPKETLAVTDLQTFVELLTIWHTRKVEILKHLMEVPKGMEILIGEDEYLVLDNDVHRAFVLGLNLGIKELGKLPFDPITDDQPEEAKVANDAST